jgi:hypothetical protein
MVAGMSARLILVLFAVEASVSTAANRLVFGRPFADVQGAPGALARWQGPSHGHRWLHRHAELAGLNAFLTTLTVLSVGAFLVTLLLMLAGSGARDAERPVEREADTVPLPAGTMTLTAS